MMKTEAPPSKVYSTPGYVSAFSIAGLLCVVLGLISLFIAISDEQPVWSAVALLLAGFANFLYAEIAGAVARTAWRTERLAYELQPVIGEILELSAQREKAERAAAKAREEEIRRAVEERQAKE